MCIFFFDYSICSRGKNTLKKFEINFSKRIFRTFSIKYFSVLFFVFLFSTEGGKTIYQAMVIFERFEDGLFNTDSGEISSLSTRFTLWDMGLERVKLAPFWNCAS